MRRRIALGGRLVLAWRPTGRALADLVRTLATSFVALGVTLYLVPGDQTSGPLSTLLFVVIVVGIGVLVRPLLAGLAVLTGPAGLLLVGLLAQAVVIFLAESIAPDVRITTYPRIVAVSWIAAALAALLNWLVDAGSQDRFYAQILGRAVRVAHRVAEPPRPGVVIVQFDGVGLDLLRQGMVSGAVPTLARWIRAGTHTGYRWHTGLPATTPAGQAVLLHGDVTQVPSFRWYEKSAGRLVVANRPADAQLVQQRISDGRGLLADDGVSISNLFSGDAPHRILTMSDARLPTRSTRGLGTFAATPLGLLRTVVVFVAQVIEETYQARRQRVRDVRPRVRRGGVFALLRGVTTALLHDLNVAMLAEQMARGAPVIFVDFVDYDEIAHHAGPSRPESMRTLDGLDRVLRLVEQIAAEVGRRYELVVLSDHGQAQGEPFAALAGHDLDDLVATLAADLPGDAGPRDPRAGLAEDQAERWGPVNLLLTGAARSGRRTVGAALARRRADREDRETDRPAADEPQVALGARPRPADAADGPIVASAGSLAHVYLRSVPGRATREQIDRRHPALLTGLAAHPGIGCVMVRDETSGPIVIGRDGWRSLAATGEPGTGRDPLAVYGPNAARDLLDLDAREHVGDVVVLGRFAPELGEVAAFEDLVGSHGGLGGDQTEAFLVVPSSWPLIEPARPLAGGARDRYPTLSGRDVHAALRTRLQSLGLRRDEPDRDADRATAPV